MIPSCFQLISQLQSSGRDVQVQSKVRPLTQFQQHEWFWLSECFERDRNRSLWTVHEQLSVYFSLDRCFMLILPHLTGTVSASARPASHVDPDDVIILYDFMSTGGQMASAIFIYVCPRLILPADLTGWKEWRWSQTFTEKTSSFWIRESIFLNPAQAVMIYRRLR